VLTAQHLLVIFVSERCLIHAVLEVWRIRWSALLWCIRAAGRTPDDHTGMETGSASLGAVGRVLSIRWRDVRRRFRTKRRTQLTVVFLGSLAAYTYGYHGRSNSKSHGNAVCLPTDYHFFYVAYIYIVLRTLIGLNTKNLLSSVCADVAPAYIYLYILYACCNWRDR